METVLMIPGELEHLESLVKLIRRKKDAEIVNDHVSVVSPIPAIQLICVNKTNRSKTLHLSVEINRYVVEGLVDTGASMSVMVAVVVRELGMMHLIAGSETYKTALGIVTQALGQIDEVLVKVGGVQCTMTFMVVDTDSYNVLLGLDFLMKIGAIVDVERGLIQVRKGPGTDVEVLPLTMVNLLQRMNLGSLIQDTTSIWTETHNDGDSNWISDQDRAIITREGGSSTSTSDADTDDSEHNYSKSNQLKQIDCENEFGDTELEELVKSEGP
jgi:predicted aspartyl protease